MWIQSAENVAEVCRITLFEAFDLPIVEFLNMLSYVNYKNAEIRKQYGNKH